MNGGHFILPARSPGNVGEEAVGTGHFKMAVRYFRAGREVCADALPARGRKDEQRAQPDP